MVMLDNLTSNSTCTVQRMPIQYRYLHTDAYAMPSTCSLLFEQLSNYRILFPAKDDAEAPDTGKLAPEGEIRGPVHPLQGGKQLADKFQSHTGKSIKGSL
jgi:hypothetical protein